MTHNNLFVAFALSIALSTTICFSAQETFKYDSWITRLVINKMPDYVINIMHKLTPKDVLSEGLELFKDALSLAVVPGLALGFLSVFFYYRNKSREEKKRIKAEMKPYATKTVGKINASNEELEKQKKQLEEEIKEEIKANYTNVMQKWREEKDKEEKHRIENQ